MMSYVAAASIPVATQHGPTPCDAASISHFDARVLQYRYAQRQLSNGGELSACQEAVLGPNDSGGTFPGVQTDCFQAAAMPAATIFRRDSTIRSGLMQDTEGATR